MFVIEVPYFDLDQIYESRQAPRWIKLRDQKYVIPFCDKALKIEQQKNRLLMSCNEEDFYNIWYNYFDLKTDYCDENRRIKSCNKKFKVPANRGNGIHVLNQDVFESYVFGKLVENVGFIRAKIAINRIASICGICHVQSMKEAGKVTWHEFPAPEMILDHLSELSRMRQINKWLKKLCTAILNNDFKIEESDNQFFRLFALHDTSNFPIVGIDETLKKNFDCDPDDFADWYLDKCENKGLIYLYILHHISNPPKEMKRWV